MANQYDNSTHASVLNTQHMAGIIVVAALAILVLIRWGFNGVGFNMSASAGINV